MKTHLWTVTWETSDTHEVHRSQIEGQTVFEVMRKLLDRFASRFPSVHNLHDEGEVEAEQIEMKL